MLSCSRLTLSSYTYTCVAQWGLFPDEELRKGTWEERNSNCEKQLHTIETHAKKASRHKWSELEEND